MNTIFEILLDVSGSMGKMKNANDGVNYLLPDGATRISLAKAILCNEVIPTLDYASNIFIRTFSSTQEYSPIILTINDGQTKTLDILKKINLIADDTPSGGTPITAALNVSLENFKKIEFDGHEKVVILISDGEENGGGDYIKVVKEAIDNGIKFKMHIVGIALNDNAIEKNKKIATLTMGSFHSLNATNYDKVDLKNTLLPLNVSVLSESIISIKQKESENSKDSLTQQLILENKIIKMELEALHMNLDKNIKSLQNSFIETQTYLEKNNNQIFDVLQNPKISDRFAGLELRINDKIEELKNDTKKINENILNSQNIQKSKIDSLDHTLNTIFKGLIDIVNSNDKVDKYYHLIDEIQTLKNKLTKNKILYWSIIIPLFLAIIFLSIVLLYILRVEKYY